MPALVAGAAALQLAMRDLGTFSEDDTRPRPSVFSLGETRDRQTNPLPQSNNEITSLSVCES
jgi:hypothetical protein